MEHNHNLVDSDNRFIIDPITRSITTSNTKLKFMRGDHNFERCTFEIPQYIDGHDMSLCNDIRINYENVSSNRSDISTGPYKVMDAQVLDGKVVFSWLISRNATKYAGTLQFSISFRCVTGSIVDYAWSTDTFKNVIISDVVNNGDEAVVETYVDILSEWEERLFGEGGSTGGGSSNELTDTVTGKKYKLEVADGKLTMTEVTE